mgnify:FL=1
MKYVLIVCLFLMACETTELENVELNLEGKVSFSVAGVPSEVHSISGNLVQGENTLPVQLTVQNGEATGELDVPVGVWVLSLDGFSASGTKIYTGSGTVTVQENQISDVRLLLEPVTGTIRINTSFKLRFTSLSLRILTNGAVFEWKTNLPAKSTLNYKKVTDGQFTEHVVMDSLSNNRVQIDSLNGHYQYFIVSRADSQRVSTDTTQFSVITISSDNITSANVFWVGHSLISHKDWNDNNATNLIEQVGVFAQSQSLSYTSYKHTNPGAPLSWNWASPYHSDMTAEAANLIRAGHLEMTAHPGKYDVLVMTEGVPFINFGDGTNYDNSSFYARKFFGFIKNMNPDARVYLYESWSNLYALSSDDFPNTKPQYYDWGQRLTTDRNIWNTIATEAGNNTAPHHPEYTGYRYGGTDPGTTSLIGDVYIIPVGQALKALHERLLQPQQGDNWSLTDTTTLSRHHLVYNGYTNWPSNWPASPGTVSDSTAQQIINQLVRFHPGRPLDDIHFSQIGIYFVSLVHYATLYKRSPVGLPTTIYVPNHIALQMQQIAWEVVRNDPRSGVNGQ